MCVGYLALHVLLGFVSLYGGYPVGPYWVLGLWLRRELSNDDKKSENAQHCFLVVFLGDEGGAHSRHKFPLRGSCHTNATSNTTMGSKHDEHQQPVIELLDESSDDDADQKQPSSTNDPVTIDLCDDDDDGLARKPSPKRKHATRRANAESSGCSDGTERASRGTVSASDERRSLVESRRVTYVYPTSEPKTHRSTILENEPISLLDDTEDEGADEDDDDYSILNDMGLGLKRKHVASKSASKQPARAKTAQLPPKNPYASQSSPQRRSSMSSIEGTVSSSRRNRTVAASASEQPSHRQPVPRHPTHNPYAIHVAPIYQNPAPTAYSTSRPFPYPNKLTQHSKQYSDIRAQCMLAFWKYGCKMTRHAHERSKLDIVGKRVVRLALSTFPIRSIEELSVRSSHHGSVELQRTHRATFLKELQEGRLDSWQVPVGRPGSTTFYSITEACLVALSRVVGSEENLGSREYWLSLSDLITEIDKLLHSCVPGKLTRSNDDDNGAKHYLQPSTRSLEFLQVKKLEVDACGGPFIKRHTVKGSVHYELLRDGLDMARKMQSRMFPSPDGFYRCSHIESVDDVVEDYREICLGVDLREGGGGTRTLHRMCDTLDKMHVPFFVASLDIGDYVFFTRNMPNGAMNLLCPILVERKSIQVRTSTAVFLQCKTLTYHWFYTQDVAMSIYDNRWTNQKKRMYKGQYVFGYDNCRMVYIIEGNMNKQTVSGDYVGTRWFNIKTDGIEKEIENLKAEGFDVLRTTSVENSMMQLARWTQRVAKDVRHGSLKAKYTYENFKKCVNRIPREVDFSKIAKDHAASKLEAQEAAAAKEQTKEQPVAKRQRTGAAREAEDQYLGWKKSELEAECRKFGLPKTGRHGELVQRLLGPHPPKIWLMRKQRGQVN